MAKVTIYRDKDYRNGMQLGEGRYDTNRLSAWGFHDAISSVRVPAGMTVTLYDHENWRGESLQLASSTPWIGDAFNDRTSSLEVRSNDITPRPVVFEHRDSEGSSMVLGPENHSDLERGVGNDAISSAEVPEGFLVALFEHRGYKGRAIGLTTSIRHLGQLDFNDMTACVRVYRDADYESELYHGPPPSIPREMTDYNADSLPEFTDQVVRSEALVPFSFVSDPQYVGYLQARKLPYYKLAREEPPVGPTMLSCSARWDV